MRVEVMTIPFIVLERFEQHHLDGAVALSQQAKWPHRRKDWELVLAVSQGAVATNGSQVLGTIMVTPYGQDTATINMVIVDERQRGLGIGKRLMNFALEQAKGRQCLLIATQEGLPLYKKLGFVNVGQVVQHQGLVSAGHFEDGVGDIDWYERDDLASIIYLDRQALGFDRSIMLQELNKTARFAVVRDGDKICGFAAVRDFGRGKVIGPVVAKDVAQAKELIAFILSAHQGQFMRVDTKQSAGIANWLTSQGLEHVGGGIAMSLSMPEIAVTSTISSPAAASDAAAYKTFALVNQAFG